jgi:hypothetical protein
MSAEMAVGVFADRAQAEAAIQALQARGFTPADVSLIMNDPVPEAEEEAGHEGATTGAAVGGVLGGIGGWLIGAGMLMIPGVGPILAAGPLMAALGGAVVGASTGGIVGVLTGVGLTEAHAKQLEQRVREGGVVVTVGPTARHEEVRALLRELGATETDFSLIGDERPAPPAQTPQST